MLEVANYYHKELHLACCSSLSHINIKNLLKFRADNLGMKTKRILIFQNTFLKINIIYLLWKPKLPNPTFSSRVYFTKLPWTEKKIELCKVTVASKNCFPEFVFISGIQSSKNFTWNISQWKNILQAFQIFWYRRDWVIQNCLKSVQIQIYFWSVFFSIQSE